MTERVPSSGLELRFFSPLCRGPSSRGASVQPFVAPRVVLVSSLSANMQGGLGSEEWFDFQCDCSDCDCACFADDD